MQQLQEPHVHTTRGDNDVEATGRKLTFALVGCGAVAHAHLPALRKSRRVDITAVVDKHLPRAREIAAIYGVPRTLADYRELDGADAAIVALPHSLHAPVAIDLLSAGVHVLVEKPMAMTEAECDAMIQAANQNRRVLAVGHVRRWFDSSRFVKRLLRDGWLGRIKRFDMREGFEYRWPAASDFTFRREGGGGVLVDSGAHALDTLLWWLGDVADLEYFDDAQGGVEADCELHLTLSCGAEGVVELSRTRALRNTVIIEGERGRLEVESKFNSLISLHIDGEELSLRGRASLPGTTAEEAASDLFDHQLEDFAGAILGGREPFVPGHEGKRVVALIEACRRQHKALPQPWAVWDESTV